MSKTSASSWIHEIFQQVGVMALALALGSLPFAAAAAEAQTAQKPTAVWTMLANGVVHAAERVV